MSERFCRYCDDEFYPGDEAVTVDGIPFHAECATARAQARAESAVRNAAQDVARQVDAFYAADAAAIREIMRREGRRDSDYA